MRKKIFCLILVLVLGLSFVGCSNTTSTSDPVDKEIEKENIEANENGKENQGSQEDQKGYVIDFEDVESFEEALNNGEDLTGKVVKFVVSDYRPINILGINCTGGEHLNFILEEEADIAAGDTLIGTVYEVAERVAIKKESWKIPFRVYDIIKQEVEEEPEEVKTLDVDLSAYLSDEEIEKIIAIEGLEGIRLMITDEYEEFGDDYGMQAVIFLDLDSIDEEDIDGNIDYLKEVRKGACIEVLGSNEKAISRDAYLTGFYFFGLAGCEHKAVGNYVIQVSSELDSDDKESLMEMISNSLVVQEDSEPTPTTTPVPTDTPEPTEQPTAAPTIEPTATPEATIAPTEAPEITEPTVAPTEEPAEVNPYNKVADYEITSIRQDYAHIDSDVVRLGNGEGAWFIIEASPATTTADDITFLYDENMLEIADLKFSTVGNTVKYEVYVKAKKAGVSEVFIAPSYDLWEDFENASGYSIPVKGLESSEGKVVYITSSGEKYHFSESCAGAGAYETTVSDAQIYEYGACGKCAK